MEQALRLAWSLPNGPRPGRRHEPQRTPQPAHPFHWYGNTRISAFDSHRHRRRESQHVDHNRDVGLSRPRADWSPVEPYPETTLPEQVSHGDEPLPTLKPRSHQAAPSPRRPARFHRPRDVANPAAGSAHPTSRTCGRATARLGGWATARDTGAVRRTGCQRPQRRAAAARLPCRACRCRRTRC